MSRKEEIIEKIFRVSNKVAKKSIKATSKPSGFFCELFYPKIDDTNPDVPKIFGEDSQRFIYLPAPDIKKTFIVIGLFSDVYKASDITFDNYNSEGDPYILTDKDFKIPTNTKCRIYRDKRYFHEMKVYTHNVFPSGDQGQIYFKNMLTAFN